MKAEKRRKERMNLVWLLLLFFAGTFVMAPKVQAASTVVSLTTGEDEVIKGDTFSVLVALESADDIGHVELFVLFDASKIAFVADGKYTTGGDGMVLISDWEESNSSTRKKYALEFKAKETGACKISVGDQPAVYLAESEEQMSVSSVNLSVEIVKQKTEEEPEKDTKEVSVTEKSVFDKTEENAVKKDETVTVLPEENEVQAPENEQSRGEPESGVHAEETEAGKVITQYRRILSEELPDEALLPEGYMKTNIRLDDNTITAYMPKEDMSCEVYLIYGTDAENNTGFFAYNRVSGTLEPYEAADSGNTREESEQIVNANFQMMTAIVVLLFICMVLSVLLALQILSKKQKKEREWEEDMELFKDDF